MRYFLIIGLLVLVLSQPTTAQNKPLHKDRKLGVSGTIWGANAGGLALEMYLSPAWEASIRGGYFIDSRSEMIFHAGFNYYFNPYTSSRWLVYSGAHFSSYYYESFCIFNCDFVEGKTQEIYQPLGVQYNGPNGFVLGLEAGVHYSWGALDEIYVIPGVKIGHRFRTNRK